MGIKYGVEDKNGVELFQDTYGEHFSNEVKHSYKVNKDGVCIDEDDNPRVLGRRILALSRSLNKYGKHLLKRAKKT